MFHYFILWSAISYKYKKIDTVCNTLEISFSTNLQNLFQSNCSHCASVCATRYAVTAATRASTSASASASASASVGHSTKETIRRRRRQRRWQQPLALLPLHLQENWNERDRERESESVSANTRGGDDNEGGSATTIKANSMRSTRIFKANQKR